MIDILLAGDFVPCYRVASQIENNDYSCLDEINYITESVDYSILNFESPVVIRNAKPIVKAGPNLKCTEKAMDCVARAGFKCVTLANNHFRDYGQIGVEDTIDSCIKYNVDFVGGGKNQYEAEQMLFKTIKGRTIGIINVCENEFSIYSERYGGSNPLNPVLNYYAIKEAKQKANYVLVIVHGGVEGYQFPTPRMQETYRFFVDAGADAVVNHHQHCYSGYEVYNGKPIFYGLGNFSFDGAHRDTFWQNGFMVRINFEEMLGFTLFPYKQGSEDNSGVALLDNYEKACFEERIGSINEIISKPESLRNQFEKFIQDNRKSRLLNMEPIYNRYIRALQKKGLLPKLIKGKALLDTFVRLNCETHSEILKKILKQEIENQ